MIAIDRDKCTGCGVCELVCPHGVFDVGEGVAWAVRERDCIECGGCQLNCEFDAVTVTKGTGCLVAIIKEDILRISPKGAGCDSSCC